MGNQPPFTYDPQNPFGGEQSAGDSQSSGYPPSYEPGGQTGQGGYPPYAPETTPPAPPSYGQPAYTPPAYESPSPYQPPPYQPPDYGQPAYGQGYTPPNTSQPPQPDYPPQATPYGSPYSQSPYGQPYGQPGAEQSSPYQPGYAQPGQYPGQYQGPYSAPYGTPYGAAIPHQDSRSGLAIAALVLGILSLVFSCANVCDAPFIVLGIIFGAMGLQSTTRRQFAVWGLALSVVALVIALVIFVLALGTHHYGFSPA